MKLVRIGLLVGAGVMARRTLRGHEHEVRARLKELGHRLGLPGTTSDTPELERPRGSHTSAASAANEPFRDDRDVIGAGSAPDAIMHPGGH